MRAPSAYVLKTEACLELARDCAEWSTAAKKARPEVPFHRHPRPRMPPGKLVDSWDNAPCLRPAIRLSPPAMFLKTSLRTGPPPLPGHTAVPTAPLAPPGWGALIPSGLSSWDSFSTPEAFGLRSEDAFFQSRGVSVPSACLGTTWKFLPPVLRRIEGVQFALRQAEGIWSRIPVNFPVQIRCVSLRLLTTRLTFVPPRFGILERHVTRFARCKLTFASGCHPNIQSLFESVSY